MPGHRILADITLLPTEEGGLTTPVEAGNRSLILVFQDTDEDLRLGARVEEIEGSARPGDRFKARVWFWNDVAALHATPKVAFGLWYGRAVGSGTVLEVLPAW